MRSRLTSTLPLCLFVFLFLQAPPNTIAQQPEEKKPKYKIGDLISIEIPIRNYFNHVQRAGDVPTFYGLQIFIEDFYADLIKEFNAFEDLSDYKVDVRYEEETRRVLIDVDFHLEKENQTSLAGLDLNKVSSSFDSCNIPVMFRITSQVNYLLEVRDVDGLEMKDIQATMSENLFFTLEEFTMLFSAYGYVEEGDGENDLHLFPEGFKPVEFTISGLELIADPQNIHYSSVYTMNLLSNRGTSEITGSELGNGEFEFKSELQTELHGYFTLKHKRAEGELALEVKNDHMEKNGNTALHIMNGQLKFPAVSIGRKITIKYATLVFEGATSQFELRGKLERDQLLKIFPEKKVKKMLKKADSDGINIEGSYNIDQQRFEGNIRKEEVILEGELRFDK